MKQLFKKIKTSVIIAIASSILLSSTPAADNQQPYIVNDCSDRYYSVHYVNIDDLNLDDRYFDYSTDNFQLRSSNALNVHHFYQDGQTYSNDYLGTWSNNTTYTIGNAGCLVTCIAMYHRFLEGSQINPAGINLSLKAAGLDTSFLSLDGVATAYGWTSKCRVVTTITSVSTAKTKIQSEINSGRPVIIGLAKFNSNNEITNTHFVLSYDYSGTNIYIHDPSKATDYTLLSQYTNNGWKIYNLRSYSK